LRGLSSLVISIVMLSVLIPIGYILLDRVRAAGSEVQQPSIYPLIAAYSIRNGSLYMLVIVNLGPGRALVEGILDDGLGYHEERLEVGEGSPYLIFTGYRPYKLVLEGGYTVDVKQINT